MHRNGLLLHFWLGVFNWPVPQHRKFSPQPELFYTAKRVVDGPEKLEFKIFTRATFFLSIFLSISLNFSQTLTQFLTFFLQIFSLTLVSSFPLHYFL